MMYAGHSLLRNAILVYNGVGCIFLRVMRQATYALKAGLVHIDLVWAPWIGAGKDLQGMCWLAGRWQGGGANRCDCLIVFYEWWRLQTLSN